MQTPIFKNSPARCPRAVAFTLVELLITISIIAILVGLVTYGFTKIQASSRVKQTRVVLDNCKAMLAEYEKAAGTKALASGSITAPGDVKQEQGLARFYDAPTATRAVFARLAAIPANKSVLSRMDESLLLRWDWGATPPPTTAWAAGTNYVGGQRVSHVEAGPVTNYYIALSDHTSSVDSEPPASPWTRDVGSAQIILADAWGNPIIYVPAGGLIGVKMKGEPSSYLSRITSAGAFNDANSDGDLLDVGETAPSLARAFFASAGPDGIFGRAAGPDGITGNADDLFGGDDNVYSFEN